MEKIMDQAAELGRLIKKTAVYSDFVRLSGDLAADGDASKLLDEYANLSASLQERKERGDLLEQFELEQLRSLADMISGNGKIMSYLSARERYLGLLSEIQERLGEG